MTHHQGETSIRLGDGRAWLAKEHSGDEGPYDILVADAFSNDALPMHLLTKEAMSLYRSRVAEDGVIAIHVTNRNLDLAPIVLASADALGIRSALIESAGNVRWVILFNDTQRPLPTWADSTQPSRRTAKPWTDDYGSLLQAIR